MSVENFETFKDGINKGLFMEMFDQFYDDNVEMIQNGATIVGKVQNREIQEKFIQNSTIHEIKIVSFQSEGDTIIYQMIMNFEVGGHVINKNQEVHQTWANGKVVKELYI
ncbi:hypothetical protein ACTA71_003142 [Dictyostelium dimigraforme]